MKKAPYISENVTYREVIRSQVARKKGINNEPGAPQLENIRRIAQNVFQPVREYYNSPIYISSFFRSQKLNEIIGGSNTSQHLANGDCAAMDLDGDVFGTPSNAQIFAYIARNLVFDQLIWEFGDTNNPDWIHVSYCRGHNRLEMLMSTYNQKGKVVYLPFDESILSTIK